MIGMIVVGAVNHHQIGLELADHGNHLIAILQRWHKSGIVNIERNVFNAEFCTRGGGFCTPAPCQGRATRFVMSRIAVGKADHFYDIAAAAIQRSHAPRRKIGIIGMRAKDQNSQWIGWHRRVPHFLNLIS